MTLSWIIVILAVLAIDCGGNASESMDSRLQKIQGTERSALVQARHGLFLIHTRDNVVGKSLMAYGEWSEREVDLFRVVVRENDVVFDVGANIGAFSVPLSKLVGPRGTVVCFEPLRHLSQILSANLALNELTNAHVQNVAVGGVTGKVPIPLLNYEEMGNYGAYSLLEQQEWTRIRHETVPLVTLDDFLPFVGNVCPRLIKIDVEGMELDVLKGAATLLQSCSPVLHIENNCVKDSKGVLHHLANDLGYDKIYWDIHMIYQPNNYFGVEEDVISSGPTPAMSINVVALQSDTARESSEILQWMESKSMVQVDVTRSVYSGEYIVPVGEDKMIITQIGDLDSCMRA